jgi:RNA polymerase sigma-70 factor (ECF subfamily)
MERVALFNDEQAFEKLFLHFNSDLYRLAFSFVKSKDIAEEIISDSFVNIWRNRARLLKIENIKLYLYVSVKNLSIKYLSRNKAGALVNLDDILIDSISSASPPPDDQLVSKEISRIIDEAVNDLPPRCRLIFTLVREHGLKYKEVSQLLNISVKTIDAQMAIAAKRAAQSIRLRLPK